jgi:hypothetical protein
VTGSAKAGCGSIRRSAAAARDAAIFMSES